jgi:hypothetical protein
MRYQLSIRKMLAWMFAGSLLSAPAMAMPLNLVPKQVLNGAQTLCPRHRLTPAEFDKVDMNNDGHPIFVFNEICVNTDDLNP